MTFSRPRAGDAAVAILASAPSLLARISPYVGGDVDHPIDWSKVAELAAQPAWAAAERAFLGICAEIAGHGVPEEGQTFGARWDLLDGQHQALISSVLVESAQITKSEEMAVLRRLGTPVIAVEPAPASVRAIRVRLGPDTPAVVNDALGRERVGFREGASIHETWLRGRGVWRMQADRVVSSPWLLIAHAGIVRLVGTIDGVSIHGDRLAIVGRPVGDHPLIGRPDPLDNSSQNPVAYGEIDDLPHDLFRSSQ
jgi:hypothetical protein